LNQPAPQFALFEVSWEVCNRIGGIHTVLATKAKTLVERFGDDYICVGPDRISDEEAELAFDEDPTFVTFVDSCRAAGLMVRVGRWRVPGSPRTVLVDFSNLYDKKDDVLASLWEEERVDSIHGGWEYIEPVLFAWAAGQVIERWSEDYLIPQRRRGVVQAHGWSGGAALLYLREGCPSLGTVFTAHQTALGRKLSSAGQSPLDGLGEDTPEGLADLHDITAQHTLEGACARAADVLTAVSDATAREVELLHERAPDVILQNGVDLEVIDSFLGDVERSEVRARLARLASAMLGEDVTDAAHIAISGRQDAHNKGLDLMVDAVARLEEERGRRIVVWALTPTGNSGVRSPLIERLRSGWSDDTPPLGISTHNLFEEEADTLHEQCERLGIDNSHGSRVKLIHVPIHVRPGDGLLDMSYEAVLSGMDLTCFPSYYEPWGNAPQQSLSVGVPTITSDLAGFGCWARAEQLSPRDGVHVLERQHRSYDEVKADLANTIGLFLESPPPAQIAEACRQTAQRTAWASRNEAGEAAGQVLRYEEAFAAALVHVQARCEAGVVRKRRSARVELTSVEGDSPRLTPFDVAATLPAELAALERIAQNYYWCWDPEGAQLFEALSPRMWESCGHNPVAFLQQVFKEDLEARAGDAAYMAKLNRVLARLEALLAAEPRRLASEGVEIPAERPIAYFSAEYGLHESMRIYSGGLGILAGDHLKAASDLELPFIAVGLFYSHGYLHQRVTPEGEQLALDRVNDPRRLGMSLVRGGDGEALTVRIAFPGRRIRLRAWKLMVGRVPLYLLDADIPENRSEDREITRNLYGGDGERRLQQELVLGRGGARLLASLGIEPSVWHLNEGHAAFSSIERVAELAKAEGLTFNEAREVVRATTVFTTHTPVPAGHDRFSEDLMRRYFSDVPDWLGVPWNRFLALGQAPASLLKAPADAEEAVDFNMTFLALSFASKVNGVSEMHGGVSRELLHAWWPGLLVSEVPVQHVTNGVHLATWVDPALGALLGAHHRPVRSVDFERSAPNVDLDKLWSVRRDAKRRLLDAVRSRLERSFLEQCDSPALLAQMLGGLDFDMQSSDPDPLVIGFARRFAPYKRAHLVFADAARLQSVLYAADRPVVLLVAGKAHPADERGKELVKIAAQRARDEGFVGRVFFLEEYDIDLARHLVQGVDVWLNTPTRSLEASGTSGMKAGANGALNLSIADGWWPESADGQNGWTIGAERTYEEQELQDQADAQALYRLLEEEVVPLYFDRDARGIPIGWLERARHALETVPTYMNTGRMVSDYLAQAYLPQALAGLELEDRELVRERAAELDRLRKGFAGARVASAQVSDLEGVQAGDAIEAELTVELGPLEPQDLAVELVIGHARPDGDLDNAVVVPLVCTGREGELGTFSGEHRIERSGAWAYGLRLRAGHSGELVRWA